MKKVLGILDAQEVYIKYFVQYLKEEKRIGFEVQAFTKAENLNRFLEENEMEILLLPFIEFQNREVLGKEILREKVKKVFLLTEEKEEKSEEYPMIYRYQPMRDLLQDIFSYYREGEAEVRTEDSKKEERKLISVYSPVKRCQKTIFSLVFSRILNERKSVLYLNLEEYSGFSEMFGKEYEADLADILYYWKEGKDWEEQLKNSVEKWKELSYIPPVRCPLDIRNMTGREWKEWFCCLLKKNMFSYIVCDFGNGFLEMEQVLELSDRIYMPVRKDKISKAKIEEYEKYLDICGWENLKDKIYKFSADVLNDSEQEDLDMEEFYQGKFGSMVRTMMKEENGKFEM